MKVTLSAQSHHLTGYTVPVRSAMVVMHKLPWLYFLKYVISRVTGLYQETQMLEWQNSLQNSWQGPRMRLSNLKVTWKKGNDYNWFFKGDSLFKSVLKVSYIQTHSPLLMMTDKSVSLLYLTYQLVCWAGSGLGLRYLLSPLEHQLSQNMIHVTSTVWKKCVFCLININWSVFIIIIIKKEM